jgi:hypothetical protein
MSCFIPESGHRLAAPSCPLCAKKRTHALQQFRTLLDHTIGAYQGGTSRPNAFAVFKLTIVSYVVDASTGRSAGLRRAGYGRHRSPPADTGRPDRCKRRGLRQHVFWSGVESERQSDWSDTAQGQKSVANLGLRPCQKSKQQSGRVRKSFTLERANRAPCSQSQRCHRL